VALRTIVVAVDSSGQPKLARPVSRVCSICYLDPVVNVPGVPQNASRTIRVHNVYTCTRTGIVQRQ